MKNPDYRRVVLFIILMVSLLIGLKVFVLKPSVDETALTINNIAISEEKINRLFNQRSRYIDDKDFIHSVVIRQLLIQEAIKSGVQEEEAFRQSVQDYYEQSLIKIIMDRKYNSLETQIDESLVDRYMSLSGKTIDLTLLSYRQPDDRVKGNFERQEKISLPFRRLAMGVKSVILTLEPGKMSEPVFSQNDGLYSVFRLDRVSGPEPSEGHDENMDRETVRQIITEHEKEVLIDRWLDSLEEKARVRVRKTIGPMNDSNIGNDNE